MTLKRGLYDIIVTDTIAQSVTSSAPDLAELVPLGTDDAAERIVDVLGRQLRAILDEVGGEDEERTIAQLALVNDLLRKVRDDYPRSRESVDRIVQPGQALRAIHGPGVAAPSAPEIGLSV